MDSQTIIMYCYVHEFLMQLWLFDLLRWCTEVYCKYPDVRGRSHVYDARRA